MKPIKVLPSGQDTWGVGWRPRHPMGCWGRPKAAVGLNLTLGSLFTTHCSLNACEASGRGNGGAGFIPCFLKHSPPSSSFLCSGIHRGQ